MSLKKVFFVNLILIITSNLFAINLMIPYEQNGRIGYVTETLNVIIYPTYTKILNQSKYMAWVLQLDENERILRNDILFSDGKTIAVDNGARVKFINDKYYVIYKSQESKVYDLKSHNLIKSFPGYELSNSDSEDYIFIINITDSTKSRYFYVDIKGNEFLTNNSFNVYHYYDTKTKTIFYMTDNGVYKVIDFQNKPRFEKEIYEFGRIGDELFLGCAEHEQGYFDLNGNLKIPIMNLENQIISLCPVFCNSVIPCVLREGNVYLQQADIENKSNDWAIINTKGKLVKKNIEADYIYPYSTDKVAVMYKYRDSKKNYYLLDTNGNVIINRDFDLIKDSVNGYSRARSNNIDFLISAKDGKEYRVFEILIKNKKD